MGQPTRCRSLLRPEPRGSRRWRFVLALAAALTVTCSSETTPTPSPRLTASASPTLAVGPAPSSSFGAQPPGVVLDVRLGPSPDQPGLSRAVPTGASRGPTSIAVGEDGLVYLWDTANGRILVYDAGRLVRRIPVAVSREARELEALNGKFYFALNTSGGRQEWELEATTGATLRTIPPPLTGQLSTLYPTTRWTPATPAVNGVWPIGIDRYDNRYEHFIDGTCSRGAAVCLEVRRRSPSGTLIKTATEPAGIAVEDYYVARDGAVYELRTDRAPDGDVAGVFVIRLLSAP